VSCTEEGFYFMNGWGGVLFAYFADKIWWGVLSFKVFFYAVEMLNMVEEFFDPWNFL